MPDLDLIKQAKQAGDLVLRLVQKIHPVSALIVFPANPAPGREQGAGIHVTHGHRQEPVRGPREARTRGPV
jgi:hypothetical protein